VSDVTVLHSKIALKKKWDPLELFAKRIRLLDAISNV